MGPSRLRKKFVRVFLLAGLVPLILMGAVSAYLVNLTHRIDVTALENNLASQVSGEIKKIIDDAVSVLEIKVTFEELAPIAFNQQDFLLEGILKNNGSLSEASFVCLTPRQCDFGHEIKRWIKTGGESQPSQILRDLSKDPGFLAARDGKTYFGPVVFNDSNLNVSVAAPVLNKNGQVVSVAKARMNFDLVQKAIEEVKLGETGYVYVIDQNGVIISHPDKSLLGKSAAGLPAAESVIKPDSLIKNQLVYENSNGIIVSGVGKPVEAVGWGVVAEWPRAETQELIRAIFIQIAAFALIALILIAVIASWIALKLIEPIAELRQGTSVLGGGNFNYKVNIKTGDELEDLGKNLNKMAENLKGLEEVHELRLRTEMLSESLKKEQELSKLKDQFITTVTHQFNTPLSIIKWALDELSEPKLTKEKIKNTSAAISKSQRDIVSIVDDLVTLSEVGFRYQKTKAKPTDIAKLIQKAIEISSEAAKIKNVAVIFKPPTEPAIAEVNEFTMEKVFENLIDNAVGYSNDGGNVAIEIEAAPKEIKVKIKDNGIGIPKEDQTSIFEQFFRARNAMAKKNVGTGLGLFIAKTVIEGHGGRITFQSEENKGSTFYVAIPR